MFSGCSVSGEVDVDKVPVEILEPRDGLTNALLFVDYEHHEVHSGSAYILSNQALLGSGATFEYVINTSGMQGKQVHLLVLARSTSEANLFIYENVTWTGGTTNGEANRNRNLNKTALVTIIQDATVLTTQTKILEEHFGNGRNIGGESRSVLEFILKENETYSIEFESEASNNDVSWLIEWYEHTPKEAIN